MRAWLSRFREKYPEKSVRAVAKVGIDNDDQRVRLGLRECPCCPCLDPWVIVSTCTCEQNCQEDVQCGITMVVNSGNRARGNKYLILRHWLLSRVEHSVFNSPCTGTMDVYVTIDGAEPEGTNYAQQTGIVVNSGLPIDVGLDGELDNHEEGGHILEFKMLFHPDSGDPFWKVDRICYTCYPTPEPIIQQSEMFRGQGDVYVIPQLLLETAENACLCPLKEWQNFQLLKGPFDIYAHAAQVVEDDRWNATIASYALGCVCKYNCEAGTIAAGFPNPSNPVPVGVYELLDFAGPDLFPTGCATAVLKVDWGWSMAYDSGSAYPRFRRVSGGQPPSWPVNGFVQPSSTSTLVFPCDNWVAELVVTEPVYGLSMGMGGDWTVLNLQSECTVNESEWAAVPNDSDALDEANEEYASLYLGDMPEMLV